MLEPDTFLNDRYRLIEPIGEGGMATVYRALDTRLGRSVAIKVLHPEFARDQPFVQRFQQEAEFAASLGAHPNIVAIYDIGQDGGLHYIVMELVEGRSLKDLIRERAPFPVGEAFAIGRQVASALDFAHRRGLVHRDIKPQNIMVTPDGVAKVTDFGIARSLSASQLTRTGMVMGTVHYFSPEQAQGKPAVPASDIYSLGIILYEMLTAHLPFDAENAVGVAMQHLQTEAPSPWLYNKSIPAGAVATVMRALEKDPEKRYRDAAEFAAALTTPQDTLAGTTAINPVVAGVPRQRTAAYSTIEEVAPRRTVVREPVAARAAPATPARPQRSLQRQTLIALGALLLAAGIAAAAFFAANNVLGGGSGSRTPTATATPKPTATPHPRRKPTALPTVPVVVPTLPPTSPPVQPTSTPVPVVPTFTPVPRPRPTNTRPPAQPTAAPTVEILGPTATPTPVG